MDPKSRAEIFRLLRQDHLKWEKTQALLADIIQKADDPEFKINLSDFNDAINYKESLIADLVKAYIISSPGLSAQRIEYMTAHYREALAQKKDNFNQIALGIILGIFEASDCWFNSLCPTCDWPPMLRAVSLWTTTFLGKFDCPTLPGTPLHPEEAFSKRFDPAVKKVIPYIAGYHGFLLGALNELDECQAEIIPPLIWQTIWNISYALLGRCQGSQILKATIAIARLQR